jgi:DNA modification methylase
MDMHIRCAHDGVAQITSLKSHPKNRNKHPKEQIERLAKILAYQGWRYPIKVSTRSGFVTSGHGRIEAAKLNGWDHVPVNHQDYESDEQEYADVQSDNAIASWAELDLSGVNLDVVDLGPDFDIDLLGIKDFEIEPADRIEPGCDEDEVPEHVEPKTKLGDIYQLGAHRLMCGDSTSIDAVERLADGSKVQLLCWDPPFNVGFKYEGAYQGSDSKSDEDYGNFLKACLYNFIVIADSKYSAFVWQGMLNIRSFGKWFSDFDWRLISVTKNFVQARSVWLQWATDPVVAWTTDIDKKNPVNCRDWFLANTANTSQTEDRIISGKHPCPRSIDVCEYFINNWSKANDNILDLSGGSGSTLIACEKTNRQCFMMELDPHYCDVIVARWEKYTGKQAELINGTP